MAVWRREVEGVDCEVGGEEGGGDGGERGRGGGCGGPFRVRGLGDARVEEEVGVGVVDAVEVGAAGGGEGRVEFAGGGRISRELEGGRGKGGLPRFSRVLGLPVADCYVHAALALHLLARGDRGAGRLGVVDLARAVPGDVLVLVVGFAGGWEAVVGVGELAFYVASFSRCFFVVVVCHLLAADYDACAEFAEDGSRCDYSYAAPLVAVGHDVALD